MSSTRETNLERRLAARLQPARIPGAEQAWAQIAPHLGRPGSGRTWRTLATAATALVLVAALAAALNALIFPANGDGGQYASAPISTPTVTQSAAPAAISIAGRGNRTISISPLPPFTVFQPGNLPDGMLMLAQSYRSEAQPGGPQQPTGATAGAMAAEPTTDSATARAASRWSQELLDNSQEATLVLVYAAAPDDLIGLVQRAAADKLLPAGDPITVRGLPGILTQGNGRTTVTWIEQGTYLELSVSTQQDKVLTIATIAAGLVEATITSPPPIPAIVSPAPGQPADPATAIAVATGNPDNAPGSGQGIVAGATFDRAAAAQQCGPWNPTLYTTDPNAGLAQVTCYARTIIGASPAMGYGISRLTWDEVVAQQNIAPPNSPPGDRIVWQVIFGNDKDNVVVILDTETGEPVTIMASATNP